jgi:hypothetical protein
VSKRRQTYNLNRQTQLLDIHKQFMGGLKTVDTDDALNSVFLRDVNNLALSEFGFLEKRYGTYINDEFENIPFDGTKPVQGYFEYVDDDGDVHKIIFYNGKAYIKNPKDENPLLRNVYIQRTAYITEPTLTYPVTNEIENETGWESGQFDPEVVPTPPLPPEFQFEGILTASTSSKSFIGFGVLGTEIVELLEAKTLYAKSSIGFGVLETFDVELLKGTLNVNTAKINFYQPGTENINILKTLDKTSSLLNFDFYDGPPRVQLFGNTVSHKSFIDFDFEDGPVSIGLTANNTIYKALIDFNFEDGPIAINLLAKSGTSSFIDATPVFPEIVVASFVTDGGTPSTYQQQIGPAPLNVVSPGTPTKFGFGFNGWSPSLPRTISNDVTFTAQWTPCPAAGTVLSTFCSGTDLYEQRADGDCGSVNVLIESNSVQCGFTQALPTPTVNSGTISTTSNSISMIISNNNSNSVSNVTTQISISGEPWINIATFSDSRNNISYTISGLNASTPYSWQLRNTTSTAGWSTSGTSTYGATTQAPPTPTLSAPTYQGSNIGDNTIQADYNNPNGVDTTLTVYILQNGSLVDTEFASLSAFGSGSVTFQQLSAGTTYTLEAYLSASGYNDGGPTIDTETTTAPAPPPVPSQPTNVTFDILDNHCNYHYVSLTNPNNFGVTVEVRRAGQTWQTLNTVVANHTGLVFPAVADTSSGPFQTRTYEVRFTSAGGTTSAVSYTISYSSCSTNSGLIPGDAVYV